MSTETPLPHDPITTVRHDPVPTVRGPVAAAELGVTLAHEHLFVLSSEFQSNFPHLWDREAGVGEAVRQLEQAYAAGVRTLVDMTVLGQGRDIDLVRAVAERTPVNIVLATGVYSVDGIPLFARFRGPGAAIEAEDPLIELLLRDVTTGIADSGVRAGLVKFACERTPPDGAAHRMAAVVAEVHRQTGVPVVVHCDPFEGNGIALVRLLEKEGVTAGSVVVAHAGDSADLDGLRALADTGCVLGYDRYGMTPFAPDEQRNATLAALVRAGHTAQLLVSQDHPVHIDYLTTEQRERIYPGWSYVHLFERVLPMLLKEPGIDDSTVRTLLVDNPRRLLSRIAAPHPTEARDAA
ncbi:phosphotriesterase-related protein [Streptomyces sp. NBC_01356]|uniref:phosphotriesterase family protein n=1 Tax=Streptomyces sp. NBC_01356 TaxID=2903836 RepID=UPI002E37D20D|nr:phosphotriesterase-related protein [Streptomyces sp. NBC_01356]